MRNGELWYKSLAGFVMINTPVLPETFLFI